jgi:uncharacterized membrane protein YuzA (DUF378 family)
MQKTLNIVTLILVIVGAVNWGLVGLFEFDLVAEIVGEKFGTVNVVSRIVYILVALSGLYQLMNVARFASEETDSDMTVTTSRV